MGFPRSVWLPALAVVLSGCATTPERGEPGPGDDEARVPFPALCDVSNWGDPCTVRASPNDSPSKAEIDLAVNPKDPQNVVVGSKDLDPLASDCVWAVPQVSKDGGRTWTTVYVGGKKADRLPAEPLYGWACITDPIMAFDVDGILYYPLQAYNQADAGPTCPTADLGVPINTDFCGSSFYLAVSRDGGSTFPNDAIIPMAIADGGLIFHDYPRMVVNPATGSVSTVWNAVDVTGATGFVFPYVVSTRDQGATVDPPTIVNGPMGFGTTAFASGFAASRDGTVFMTVWMGGGGDGGRPVYLALSLDDAKTFVGFRRMFDVTPIDCPLPNTEYRCGTSVELAADLSNATRPRVYAVWDDGRNGNADVFASYTDNTGIAWTAPVRINRDNSSSAQWMPRAKVGPDGTLHVMFMDRSYAPGDTLYDVTHAWSMDGVNWTSQRITEVSSDGDLGVHQNGFPFIGDYNGIDVVGDHVYLGFPQAVTGKAEIGVAHLVRDPNVPVG